MIPARLVERYPVYNGATVCIDVAFKITVHSITCASCELEHQCAVVKSKRNTCILSCDSLMVAEISSVMYNCYS